MNAIRHLFVSTYPPEERWLGTFTRDTAEAVDRAAPAPVSSMVLSAKNTRSTPEPIYLKPDFFNRPIVFLRQIKPKTAL